MCCTPLPGLRARARAERRSRARTHSTPCYCSQLHGGEGTELQTAKEAPATPQGLDLDGACTFLADVLGLGMGAAGDKSVVARFVSDGLKDSLHRSFLHALTYRAASLVAGRGPSSTHEQSAHSSVAAAAGPVVSVRYPSYSKIAMTVFAKSSMYEVASAQDAAACVEGLRSSKGAAARKVAGTGRRVALEIAVLYYADVTPRAWRPRSLAGCDIKKEDFIACCVLAKGCDVNGSGAEAAIVSTSFATSVAVPSEPEADGTQHVVVLKTEWHAMLSLIVAVCRTGKWPRVMWGADAARGAVESARDSAEAVVMPSSSTPRTRVVGRAASHKTMDADGDEPMRVPDAAAAGGSVEGPETGGGAPGAYRTPHTKLAATSPPGAPARPLPRAMVPTGQPVAMTRLAAVTTPHLLSSAREAGMTGAAATDAGALSAARKSTAAAVTGAAAATAAAGATESQGGDLSSVKARSEGPGAKPAGRGATEGLMSPYDITRRLAPAPHGAMSAVGNATLARRRGTLAVKTVGAAPTMIVSPDAQLSVGSPAVTGCAEPDTGRRDAHERIASSAAVVPPSAPSHGLRAPPTAMEFGGSAAAAAGTGAAAVYTAAAPTVTFIVPSGCTADAALTQLRVLWPERISASCTAVAGEKVRNVSDMHATADFAAAATCHVHPCRAKRDFCAAIVGVVWVMECILCCRVWV